ncbi:MAG: NTPase [Candidatus Bathyarchaeia archaeon]|nr:NTPase [Candidatus Bathyarchaeota archaeon]
MFLTGPPRIGKTTVILKVLNTLREKNVRIGGMISQEILERGVRVGFKIIDLLNNLEGILAHINRECGPQIGKYRVCLEDLEKIGVKAILNACERADIVVIDEVGPMELYSETFKDAVLRALNSGKIVLGTIHWRAKTPFTEMIRQRGDVKIIEVKYENRNVLPKIISEELLIKITGLEK